MEDTTLGTENAHQPLKVRLDQWLWAARFFKTRPLARLAVIEGQVLYNGTKVRPSQEIEIGARLNVQQGSFEKNVLIKALCTRRRSLMDAARLFAAL